MPSQNCIPRFVSTKGVNNLNQITMEQEKTYWNNKGKYEKESKFIWMLIPVFGEVVGYSPKVNEAIESVRILNRFYYDIYNNGGCNLCGYENYYGDEYYRTEWFNEYGDEVETAIKFVLKNHYEKSSRVKDEIKSNIVHNRINFDELERIADYIIIKAFRTIKNHLLEK